MDRTHFVNQLAERLSDAQPHTVRIYGHGASGKTVLIRDLLALLDPKRVNLLQTDTYMVPGSYQDLVKLADASGQRVTASLPIAHELISLTRDIQALKKGVDLLTIDCPPWAPQTVLSGDKPILIVEGMASAFLDKELFDLSIACYTDNQTELNRRLARDVAERGGVAENIRAGQAVRRQQYETYYQPLLDNADIVINQSQNQFLIERLNS